MKHLVPIMGKQFDESPQCLQYHEAFFNLTVTNEKCVIQFSSILLFNLLVNKMMSDFQLPADVHVYNFQTRKDKLKCSIKLNTVLRLIEVSEAGYNVWRQEFIDKTVPFLLSQLVRKTNADLASTPDLEQKDEDDIVISKPIVPNDDNSNTRSTCCSNKDDTLDNAAVLSAIQELSRQVDTLRKERSVAKPSYASIIPKESSATTSKAATHSTTGSSNSGAASTSMTHPKRTATPTRENNAPAEKKDSKTKKIQSVVKNVLLTGSSIISRINPKGLLPNIHKHAIPGATVKTLMTDLRLFNMKNFESVFLYIGGNDAANGTDIELIEEMYDQLIVQLQSSNPNLKIYISKVAPRGDTDVSSLNTLIERLSAHHEIEIVDIFAAFHDKNGFVCNRYFNNDSIHPSPSGVKRILGTLNRKVSIVQNFDMVVYGNQGGPDRRRVQSRPNVNDLNLRTIRPSMKCIKCGELNHHTQQCRHRSPVTCWGCGFSGHKQQHCWAYA